jgi:membrane protease YdiL (CAAX protease family)
MNQFPTVAGQHGGLARSPERGFLALLLAMGAFAASLGVAFTNESYFQLISRLIPVSPDHLLLRGALFSSYLLLISAPFVVWRPRFFGLQRGEITRHMRLIAVVTVGFALFTALSVSLTGGTPYSGRNLANLINEVIIVPASEELFFRGLVFAALLAGMRRLYPERQATWLAISVAGVSFGAAHLGNFFVTSLALSFVLPQAIFASLLGIGCCYLMAKTQSLFPAVLLHAVVNLVAVLL